MRSSTISILIFLGILILLNLLASRFSFRLDLTEGKQYTLHEATRTLIDRLEEPVTVKAYFSEDLPPNFMRGRKEFKDLLMEYAARAKGRLVYEFIDPASDPKVEEEITARGVRPIMIEVREKDQKKQQKAWMAAVVEMNEEVEAIPFIEPGGTMEYSLSRAIKKLSVLEKPKIGFIQGHGEPEPAELMQVRADLGVLYDLEPYYIAGGTVPGPDRFPAMLWVRPTDTIPQKDFDFMSQYLANGGRLLVAFNAVDGNLTNMQAMPQYTGMTDWLAGKGLRVDKNLVIDDRCGSVSVQQEQGMFSFASNVAFPYLPLMRGISDNVISGGLESVLFEFPSELQYVGDTTKMFQPIIYSSAVSNVLNVPHSFEVERKWTRNDFTRSNVMVGGVLTGSIESENYAELLVYTDGDFAINGPRDNARQLQADNVSLFVNSVDWLVDDTGLIELRTRGVIDRPLDPLAEETRSLLKFGNFLLPVILVILYGLVRAQRRRALRRKRMNPGYFK